jgi:hypothetical protein
MIVFGVVAMLWFALPHGIAAVIILAVSAVALTVIVLLDNHTSHADK